jgi:predicted Zn-dependent protease
MRGMGSLLELSKARSRGARPGHDTVIPVNPAERFEALLASGKDGALLRFSLGMHYLKEGAAAKAAEHLRAAVAHDPGYSAAWKLLGKALSDCAESVAAMDAYRKGIEAAERKGDKQAAKEMAVFLRRLEKGAAGGSGSQP